MGKRVLEIFSKRIKDLRDEQGLGVREAAAMMSRIKPISHRLTIIRLVILIINLGGLGLRALLLYTLHNFFY